MFFLEFSEFIQNSNPFVGTYELRKLSITLVVWCILSDQQIYSNVPFSVCANIQAKSLHKIIDTYLIKSPRVCFSSWGQPMRRKVQRIVSWHTWWPRTGLTALWCHNDIAAAFTEGHPFGCSTLLYCIYVRMPSTLFYSPVDMVTIFVLQSQITSLFYQTSWQSSSTTKHTILHISAGWIKRSESFWSSSQKLLLACGGVGRGIPTWTTPTWAEAWGQCAAEIVG